METVVVMGGDGYIGFALTLRLLKKGYNVIGFDNLSRRKTVKEMGSFSAIPIDSPEKRQLLYKQYGRGKYYFIRDNIAVNYKNIIKYIKAYKPKAVVNLAQQPSGPYSHIDRQHATYTVMNNIIGMLNVIYGIKEGSPDTHLISIGSMGEFDHSAGLPIYEGLFDLTLEEKTANVIYPRRPGSVYHSSKVASSYDIDCACRWYGISATDIMQAVCFGNWTPEIKETGSHTRLDSDEAFGTVVNRFIVQAVLGEPLTVFGRGEHSRGFLALNDSIQCLMLAIENPPKKGEYRTWNQLAETFTMNQVAEMVQKACSFPVAIKHIESPRKEKTDYFEYDVRTDKLKNLGFKQTRWMDEEVKYVVNLLKNRDDIFPLKDVITPKIKWR